MKEFLCIATISILLYLVLKLYVEYGNMFSIVVSGTVGITLVCLYSNSTENLSMDMKNKFEKYFNSTLRGRNNTSNNSNVSNIQHDEAFLKALKSNGEIVHGIEMVKAIESGNVTVSLLLLIEKLNLLGITSIITHFILIICL
jgi:hypothetical protein